MFQIDNDIIYIFAMQFYKRFVRNIQFISFMEQTKSAFVLNCPHYLNGTQY